MRIEGESQPEPKNKLEKPIINMGIFRAEIALLIAERNIPGEIEKINLTDLNEKDAIMWYKIKNYVKGLITQDQYEEYKKDVRDSKNPSRNCFLALVNNKLTPFWISDNMEDL